MKTKIIEEKRKEFEGLVKQGHTTGEAMKLIGFESVKNARWLRVRQREEFGRLVLSGLTQKEAAMKIGISGKAASSWNKDSPVLKLARLRASILNELGALEYNHTTETTARISELLKLLEQLNKVIKTTCAVKIV